MKKLFDASGGYLIYKKVNWEDPEEVKAFKNLPHREKFKEFKSSDVLSDGQFLNNVYYQLPSKCIGEYSNKASVYCCFDENNMKILVGRLNIIVDSFGNILSYRLRAKKNRRESLKTTRMANEVLEMIKNHKINIGLNLAEQTGVVYTNDWDNLIIGEGSFLPSGCKKIDLPEDASCYYYLRESLPLTDEERRKRRERREEDDHYKPRRDPLKGIIK